MPLKKSVPPSIEDLEISRCLQNSGAVAGDSRDDQLLDRYLPFEPHCVLKSNLSAELDSNYKRKDSF